MVGIDEVWGLILKQERDRQAAKPVGRLWTTRPVLTENTQDRPAIGYRGQSSVRCLVTKQQDVDGWECIGGMDCDGAPDDLVQHNRLPKQPIPLKVPAKRVSINAGFWMRRAINAAAEPRGIKHALTFPDDE